MNVVSKITFHDYPQNVAQVGDPTTVMRAKAVTLFHAQNE